MTHGVQGFGLVVILHQFIRSMAFAILPIRYFFISLSLYFGTTVIMWSSGAVIKASISCAKGHGF